MITISLPSEIFADPLVHFQVAVALEKGLQNCSSQKAPKSSLQISQKMSARRTAQELKCEFVKCNVTNRSDWENILKGCRRKVWQARHRYQQRGNNI